MDKQPIISPYEQMFANRKTISDLIALNPADVEVSIFVYYL